MQIKQIEHLLGMPLLEKKVKKIYLTEAGKIVKDYAEKSISSQKVLEEILAQLSGAGLGHSIWLFQKLPINSSHWCWLNFADNILELASIWKFTTDQAYLIV